MKPIVLISLLFVMTGLAFAQAPSHVSTPGSGIVTPEPTVLPTTFERAEHPHTPSPTATPEAKKLEPPGMKK